MNNNCLRNYNIDEFSPIQKGIFEIVRSLLNETVEIIEIKHEQYRELYYFKYGDAFSTIGFYYKKNNKISNIDIHGAKGNSEFGSKILKYLRDNILNIYVFSAECCLEISDLQIVPKGIYEVFYQLIEKLAKKNIKTKLIKIDPKQYYISFIFSQNCFCYVLCKFFYNKSGSLTNCIKEDSFGTSNLYEEIKKELNDMQ